MKTAALNNMDALGPAALDSSALEGIAAAALDAPSVELLSASASEITFPMFNMTTGGLWRVEGTARIGSAEDPAPFSAVVKLVQSPLLWGGIEQVPPHMRQDFVRYYPWRTEPEVYASELADAMPAGSRLPKIYSIQDTDAQRTAIWMEDVTESPGAEWDDARFRDAATLLGRLAGSTAVKDRGPVLSAEKDAERMRLFLKGVGAMLLIPGIQGDDLWKIPAVAEAADPQLIAGLRSLTLRAAELMEEIIALPALPAHGDASPQNLLIENTGGGSTDFAVIDWGLHGGACAGFDLGQLLAGLVNQGTMSGEELYRLEPLCLRAYCEGLADAGVETPEAEVRRGHAASMALFTGLSAVATQRLAEPDSDELRTFVAGRVHMARFVLDLLASTD